MVGSAVVAPNISVRSSRAVAAASTPPGISVHQASVALATAITAHVMEKRDPGHRPGGRFAVLLGDDLRYFSADPGSAIFPCIAAFTLSGTKRPLRPMS